MVFMCAIVKPWSNWQRKHGVQFEEGVQTHLDLREKEGGLQRAREVPVTDKADGSSVEHCVSVHIPVPIVGDYKHAKLFTRIKSNENPDIYVRYVSISNVIPLCT